jgi:hypothetical protein
VKLGKRSVPDSISTLTRGRRLFLFTVETQSFPIRSDSRQPQTLALNSDPRAIAYVKVVRARLESIDGHSKAKVARRDAQPGFPNLRADPHDACAKGRQCGAHREIVCCFQRCGRLLLSTRGSGGCLCSPFVRRYRQNGMLLDSVHTVTSFAAHSNVSPKRASVVPYWFRYYIRCRSTWDMCP